MSVAKARAVLIALLAVPVIAVASVVGYGLWRFGREPETPRAVAARLPIAAELLSAEVRPMRVREYFSGAKKDGAEVLVVRVRFTNSDDTFDARGAVFTASNPTDEFGNQLGRETNPWPSSQVDESPDFTDLTPSSPAVRSFVFAKPIPKATSVRLTITGHFDRAAVKRAEFPFIVPLPAR